MQGSELASFSLFNIVPLASVFGTERTAWGTLIDVPRARPTHLEKLL